MSNHDTKIGSCRIAQNGPLVILYINGKAHEMTWEAAQIIAQGLYEKAKAAEEYAKAEDIIFDQAIMYRSGAPFALSDNAKIQDEAKKEAVYNRELRRSNLKLAEQPAGGIPSQEQVGVPTVSHVPGTAPSIIIPK